MVRRLRSLWLILLLVAAPLLWKVEPGRAAESVVRAVLFY